MKEIDKVLDTGEKVLWEGKPNFGPFILTGTIPSFIFGLIWLAFLVPFIVVGFLGPNLSSTIPDVNVQNVPVTSPAKSFISIFFIGWNLFLIPFLLIGLWMLIGMPIYKLLLHKHLYYAITNKRVIIQKGVIGRDFEYIDFDQITNAEVSVGLWDKIIGKDSGSILISSAGSFTHGRHGNQISRPYTLSNIQNPYDVFKFVKNVSYAVKTDIEYPNKLRPTENPGYNTKYDPNKK